MVFLPSSKSAENSLGQTRIIDGAPDTVMRGVVATMHDLGYRITKSRQEPGRFPVRGRRRYAWLSSYSPILRSSLWCVRMLRWFP